MLSKKSPDLIKSVLSLRADGYTPEVIAQKLDIEEDQVNDIIRHGVESVQMLNKMLMMGFTNELLSEAKTILDKLTPNIIRSVGDDADDVAVDTKVLRGYNQLLKSLLSASSSIASAPIRSSGSLSNDGDNGQTTIQQGFNLTITSPNAANLFRQATQTLLDSGEIVIDEEEQSDDN